MGLDFLPFWIIYILKVESLFFETRCLRRGQYYCNSKKISEWWFEHFHHCLIIAFGKALIFVNKMHSSVFESSPIKIQWNDLLLLANTFLLCWALDQLVCKIFIAQNPSEKMHSFLQKNTWDMKNNYSVPGVVLYNVCNAKMMNIYQHVGLI